MYALIATILFNIQVPLTNVHEPDSTVLLQSVSVSARRSEQQQQTQDAVTVGAEYLESHFGASLMQSLESLPGVKAVSIGSGLSRPTLRGMGGNRLVVADNGVKHESQQWGEDHGLEVDQMAVGEVQVIKGPATLLYGSDAIGGVLALQDFKPSRKAFEASVSLFGRTNNSLLGGSITAAGRGQHGWRKGLYYRATLTRTDYGDYRVPTDSIQYYSYYIRLDDGHLRNTAGQERDARLTLGYTNDSNFRTDLTLSNVYTKSGFFANAHGLEVRLSSIDYDASRRDIDLPMQWVNHTKLLSHTTWTFGDVNLHADLAFQNNRREELSEPLSHGYMPQPPDSLERQFSKQTYTANVSARMPLGEHHELTFGTAAEHQHNRRAGWGFIIPDFESSAWGLYATDSYRANSKLNLTGGVRFDMSRIHIASYTDWYCTPDAGGTPVFMQRSADTTRNFSSLTWSVGGNYHTGPWLVRLNIGKAFRTPIAKELGADGVNYHIFRYEQGNAALDPEQSYQADLGGELDFSIFHIALSTYYNYFPNYIYLNPMSEYREGLQLYQYTQTKARRYGFEAEASAQLCQHWQLAMRGEWSRSRQLDGMKKGYTLPFAVPWSADLDVHYHFNWKGKGNACLNLHTVGAQYDIVPPESPTDGYATINLSLTKQFPVKCGTLNLSMQANNLLDTKYYDHTSFYRLNDIPEPGRNISIKIKYEF